MNQPTTPQFSIADLAVIKNIIDTACARGAFQAAEMKSVGEIYERLDAFLKDIVAQAKAQEQTQPPQGE